MTRFDPRKTQNYSRTFGPARVNGKQSRLPVDASSLFHGIGPKQNRGPQPEQMAPGPSPYDHLNRMIGLDGVDPLPRQ